MEGFPPAGTPLEVETDGSDDPQRSRIVDPVDLIRRVKKLFGAVSLNPGSRVDCFELSKSLDNTSICKNCRVLGKIPRLNIWSLTNALAYRGQVRNKPSSLLGRFVIYCCKKFSPRRPKSFIAEVPVRRWGLYGQPRQSERWRDRQRPAAHLINILRA